MTLTSSGQLNQFLRVMQGYLFPKPKEQLSPLTDKLRQLIAVPEPIQIEAMVGPWRGGVGRPARHERAIARAFVAKTVYNMSHTRELLYRLLSGPSLRRICGWRSRREISHESQFSRAFAGFAASELPQRCTPRRSKLPRKSAWWGTRRSPARCERPAEELAPDRETQFDPPAG